VGRSLVRYLENLKISPAPIENVVSLPEGGLRGQSNGVTYELKPLNLKSTDLDSDLIQSAYGLFEDQKLIGSFQMGDQPRADAMQILSWARKNHLTTQMISGDRQHVVEKCARTLGFFKAEVHAEMSPEMKARTLRSCHDGNAMIGDGANDAAALAAANIGIAVCGSLDLSLRSADVYLTRSNLTSIIDLFEIARRTKLAIYRNLFFSAAFNIASGGLAMSGLMTPLWAAALMPFSSTLILLSSTWTGKRLSEIGAKV
jgi:P-type E1-E2 ATPase